MKKLLIVIMIIVIAQLTRMYLKTPADRALEYYHDMVSSYYLGETKSLSGKDILFMENLIETINKMQNPYYSQRDLMHRVKQNKNVAQAIADYMVYKPIEYLNSLSDSERQDLLSSLAKELMNNIDRDQALIAEFQKDSSDLKKLLTRMLRDIIDNGVPMGETSNDPYVGYIFPEDTFTAPRIEFHSQAYDQKDYQHNAMQQRSKRIRKKREDKRIENEIIEIEKSSAERIKIQKLREKEEKKREKAAKKKEAEDFKKAYLQSIQGL